MKNLICNNLKLITGICMITLTIAVITFLGVTYATDGSQVIYTRDELSELYTEIKNNDLIRNDAYIAYDRDIPITANNETIISLKNYPYYNDKFSLSNNRVTINQNGFYLVSMYTDLNFPTSTANYFIVTKKNNGVGLTYEGERDVAAGGKSSHFSDVYYLNQGDTLYATVVSPIDFTITFVKMNIIHLS